MGLPDQRPCGQLAAPTFPDTLDVGRSDVDLPGADSSGARVSDVGLPAGVDSEVVSSDDSSDGDSSDVASSDVDSSDADSSAPSTGEVSHSPPRGA